MNPVLQLILDRVSSRSTPNSRTDPHRLALVIEGGGMRGVVSAGMVTALHYLAAVDAFDAVFGSSAGAINGAYFLARQAPYGTSIYYEDINNSRFIALPRLLSGRPGMSLEYLFDNVIRSRKRLDADAVLRSAAPLHVVATSVTRSAPVTLSEFRTGDDLLLALQASSQFPLLSGPPRDYHGDRYFDGGIFRQIPYQEAIERGFTHLLALFTGHLTQHPLERILSWAQGAYMSRYSQALGSAVAGRSARNRADRVWLLSQNTVEGAKPAIYTIGPEGMFMVRRTETRQEVLLAGARAGFYSVYSALGKPRPAIVPILQPFAVSSGQRMAEAINGRGRKTGEASPR